MRFSLIALALLTACTPEICGRTSDCAPGLVCTAAGACATPADAGGDGPPGDAPATEPGDAASEPIILGGAAASTATHASDGSP